jgi:AAA+ ATPase superfamily predicted ATPase
MVQTNPFTPQSGLEPKVFSGRGFALREFSAVLEKTETGIFEHLLVLGDWGIGKTSLLRQFKKLAQVRGSWVSFCGINKVESKESILAQMSLIIEEVLINLPCPESRLWALREKFSLRNKRNFPAQTELARFLLEVWKELKTKVACILLDDIQNFLPRVELIDILRATLSREDISRETRFIFVLSSTPEGWNAFLDKHDPVGRFFRKKIILEPFSEEEVGSFIAEALKDSNVEFNSEVRERIYSYTRGHPYELQLLSSHLFDAQTQGRVDDVSWEVALRSALRDLGREYFETLYNRASERERDLLFILAEKNKPLSLTELRSVMILERKAKSFPIANIKNFIYRLCAKGLIKKIGDSYTVLDPLFREYVLRFKTY